jgi:hypothetical protein
MTPGLARRGTVVPSRFTMRALQTDAASASVT